MTNKPSSNAFKGKTFLIPGADLQVTRMVHRWGGDWTRDVDGNFDAVIFTGGEDISPFLYGESPIPGTHTNIRRDLREVHIYKNLPVSMPKIGICRGGQLLNVLCGGRMWQNVDNHARPHEVKLFTGDTIRVSSTHHQMMIPTDNAFVIGWGKEATSKQRQDEEHIVHENNWEDAEILYYENMNTLCFQPHPEYINYEDCTHAFVELVGGLFNEKKPSNENVDSNVL